MKKTFISFDVTVFNKATGRAETSHYDLLPISSEQEVKSTVENLKRNDSVSNIEVKTNEV